MDFQSYTLKRIAGIYNPPMFFAIKESSVAAFIEKIRFWLPLEVNDQFLLLIKAVFMVRILLLVACLCLSLSVSAQSLSGVVKDKASDEVLISATVKLVPEMGVPYLQLPI